MAGVVLQNPPYARRDTLCLGRQRELVDERTVNPETWAETALELVTFRGDETEAYRVGRYCEALLSEMAPACLTLQASTPQGHA